NRWCVEYNEKLRTKLLVNKFTRSKDWWIHKILKPEYAQRGGEVAPNKLISHIKPQKIIVYADYKKYKNLIIENRLCKDDNREIIFLERFWKVDKNNEFKEIVNPILIYTDLININNQRTLEMAKVIYKRYIDRCIR
ncbi:MAG: type IV toxin-antitoxin system AbiEi family antitoxin, partial [Actinomycetota bacterium]|nr:type IV toxin-antitoxin system AbiEi family antitoxin [Actinomycetota bacterium]